METPQLPTPSNNEIVASRSALEAALQDYQLKAGDGDLTAFLVHALVSAQFRSTINRAEYSGDNFKLVITTKKKR